ncbi:helix-turn-helix domain-containing protein [Candidatus Magnetaquicoccus inordinatus]|uniref:helix-turn-helix domain-containing protein n=1 Tax=Candidatus Magnetaquicoccus inordinatus TaxID=2496818 RepID=UPI003B968A81
MMNIDTEHRPSAQDWPRSRIKMHLEDKGWTLRRLSVAHGRMPTAIAQALYRPCSPPLEQIVAEEIGVQPAEIWPSRYPGGVRARNCELVGKNNTTTRRKRTNPTVEVIHGQ